MLLCTQFWPREHWEVAVGCNHCIPPGNSCSAVTEEVKWLALEDLHPLSPGQGGCGCGAPSLTRLQETLHLSASQSAGQETQQSPTRALLCGQAWPGGSRSAPHPPLQKVKSLEKHTSALRLRTLKLCKRHQLKLKAENVWRQRVPREPQRQRC